MEGEKKERPQNKNLKPLGSGMLSPEEEAAVMVVMCALGLELTSCKNGSSNSSSNLSSDGMFGEVPVVASNVGEQMDDLFESLDKSENSEEILKILLKTKGMDSTANAAINAATEKLKDKEFPTEVASEVPLKVISPFKINFEKTKNQQLYIQAIVENTGKFGTSSGMFKLDHLRVMLIDKDGQPLFTLKDHYYNTLEKEIIKLTDIGSKAEFASKLDVEPWNAEWLSKADKFLIVNSESDIFKQANDTTKSAERAYQNKMMDHAGMLFKKMQKMKE